MKNQSSSLVTFAVLHNVALAIAYLSLLLVIIGAASDADAVVVVGFVFGALAGIVQSIFHLLILHRGWSFVQDGKARTSPGKAVGYLFIPFYNLYWVFVAYNGLMD